MKDAGKEYVSREKGDYVLEDGGPQLVIRSKAGLSLVYSRR